MKLTVEQLAAQVRQLKPGEWLDVRSDMLPDWSHILERGGGDVCSRALDVIPGSAFEYSYIIDVKRDCVTFKRLTKEQRDWIVENNFRTYVSPDRRGEYRMEKLPMQHWLLDKIGCSKPGCGYWDGRPCIGCGRIVTPLNNEQETNSVRLDEGSSR